MWKKKWKEKKSFESCTWKIKEALKKENNLSNIE